MKPFILVIDTNVPGGRDAMCAWLDKQTEIVNWQATLPNAVFIVSEKSAREISHKIHEKFSKSRFFVTEIETKEIDRRGGWLPKHIWKLIKDPQPA